jgi:NDP-sugar pyrophosphorylase family protein
VTPRSDSAWPAQGGWPPRALVLTAGLGTRLRPLTHARAKAAVPVAGVPLVTRILRWLRSHGITDAVLNLHHQPETLTRIVGEGRDVEMAVRYSWEQPILGSAGGPRRALPLIERDPFLIVNGDTLTDVDLQALWREHVTSGATVTMALVPNPSPEKYGGAIVDAEGWVTGFSRRGSAEPSFHFIGAQVTAHAAFALVPEGMAGESVLGVYPVMMKERPHVVRAFISDASFLDIGTPRDYVETNAIIARQEGREPWTHGARVRIAASARVSRSILWDDVTVGEDAVLDACVVADGVTIPAGVRYEHSVIVRASGPADQRQDDLIVASLD